MAKMGPKGIDWDKVRDLGKVSDGAIAKRLGLTTPAVRYARIKRGIAAAPRKPLVYESVLGVIPDGQIAERYGLSYHSVHVARMSRAIAPAHDYTRNPSGSRGLFSQYAPLLGKVSDNSLAKRFGVGVTAVRMARVRRGIPVAR